MYLNFLDMPPAVRDTLLAALVALPERPGKVPRFVLSRTSLPLLLRGLLGEEKAGQLAFHLRSPPVRTLPEMVKKP